MKAQLKQYLEKLHTQLDEYEKYFVAPKKSVTIIEMMTNATADEVMGLYIAKMKGYISSSLADIEQLQKEKNG